MKDAVTRVTVHAIINKCSVDVCLDTKRLTNNYFKTFNCNFGLNITASSVSFMHRVLN